MLHGHLIVNRGYELIVYIIVWLTKNFPKCWHDIYNGLKWYLKHGMWKWCRVDFGCDLIVLSQWKGTITFEISAIGLIWDSYLSGNA